MNWFVWLSMIVAAYWLGRYHGTKKVHDLINDLLGAKQQHLQSLEMHQQYLQNHLVRLEGRQQAIQNDLLATQRDVPPELRS